MTSVTIDDLFVAALQRLVINTRQDEFRSRYNIEGIRRLQIFLN